MPLLSMENKMLPDDVEKKIQDVMQKTAASLQPFVGEPNDIRNREAITEAVAKAFEQVVAKSAKIHMHAFEAVPWTLEELQEATNVQLALDNLERHRCSCGEQRILSNRVEHAPTEVCIQMYEPMKFIELAFALKDQLEEDKENTKGGVTP